MDKRYLVPFVTVMALLLAQFFVPSWKPFLSMKRVIADSSIEEKDVTENLGFGSSAFPADARNVSRLVDVTLESAYSNQTLPHVSYQLTQEQQRLLARKLKVAASKAKFILLWQDKNKTDDRRWPVETCGKCVITTKRSMIDHPDTGAVVFLYNKFDAAELKNIKRRRDQLHVWYTAESPASLYTLRRMFLAAETRYQFNVTQTYRRDSGIYHPYGDMHSILEARRINGSGKDLSINLQHKTKLAVAVISNCKATFGARIRYEIIQKMKSLGLEIDTFGKCFSNPLPQKHHEFEDALKSYKFYLAFENAFHCRDYITEKFFINGFRAGLVPVALGATRADYEAVAPRGSYIFAEDFSSIASLVDYLKYLDKTDEAYLKYFKWIKDGESSFPMQGRTIRFCQLCRMTHGINVDEIYQPSFHSSEPQMPLFSDEIAERTVDNLRSWYYETENTYCYARTNYRIKQLLNFTDLKPAI